MTPLTFGPYLLGVRFGSRFWSGAQGGDTGVWASALICTGRRAGIAPGGEERGTPFEAGCLLRGRGRYGAGVFSAWGGVFYVAELLRG